MSRLVRIVLACSLATAFALVGCASSTHKTTIIPKPEEKPSPAAKSNDGNAPVGTESAHASEAGEPPGTTPPSGGPATNPPADSGVTLDPGKPGTSGSTAATTTADTSTNTTTTTADTSTTLDAKEVQQHIAQIGSWDGNSDKLPDGSKWLAIDAGDKP